MTMTYSGIRSYKDLIVWQRAIELAAACYTLARRFPSCERHGLSSQLSRAVVSISSNIAEGAGRRHRREFLQFVAIAQGSLCEVESALCVAHRVGYLHSSELAEAERLCNEVSRMLMGLRKSLVGAHEEAGPPATSHQPLATSH
jgi:four helix bundle protein